MPVNTPSKDYTEYLPKWERCRDVASGEDAVKAKGTRYLPLISPLQKAEEYTAYVQRATFYNGMGRTVQGLVGAVVRKAASVVVPEVLRPALDDITRTGVSLDAFATTLLAELLTVGRRGILVDRPADSGSGGRPYWVAYRAEQILSCRTAMVDGRRIVTRVVLSETQTEADPKDPWVTREVPQCRVLELVGASTTETGEAPGALGCVVTVYRQNDKQEWVAVEGPVTLRRRGARLPTIPFVFVNSLDITPDVVKPPLLDLVDVNLSHYRTSADLEHGRHFTALPTPYVTGYTATGDPLRIGSGTAWCFPSPESKVGMLEYTGQGLQELREAAKEKQELMAVLGARLLEAQKKAGEAAETVRLRHAGDDAVLQQIANAASAGLTQALRIHAWWDGLEVPDDQVSVTLNTDFFAVPISAEDVKTMVLAMQAGRMSFETFYYNLQRGEWARPGVDVETEKQAITEDEANAGGLASGAGTDPAAAAAAEAALAGMMEGARVE